MEDIMDIIGFLHIALYKIRKKSIFKEYNLSIYSKVTVFYIKDIARSGGLNIIIEKQ